MVQGKKVPVKSTAEEKEWNKKISLLRGRLRWVKRVFLSLDKPFNESEKQHGCVVNVAWACVGKQKQTVDSLSILLFFFF